jgi:hypothetical protein
VRHRCGIASGATPLLERAKYCHNYRACLSKKILRKGKKGFGNLTRNNATRTGSRRVLFISIIQTKYDMTPPNNKIPHFWCVTRQSSHLKRPSKDALTLALYLAPEANILDAKKLVWSKVSPKLRCTELFLLKSQTSRGEVRNFGLLGFEFKIGFFKNIFC